MEIQEYITSGIVESFVLGLASPEEVQELTVMRLQYPELDAAIIEFEMEVEAQGQMNAVAPPPRVKENLFDLLEDSFQTPVKTIQSPEEKISEVGDGTQPVEVPVMSIDRTEGSAPVWRKFATAAAVILFLANAAGSIYLYNKYSNLNTAYARLQQENAQEKLKFNSLYADIIRMQDTKVQMVRMEGVQGKEGNLATVFWDRETNEVFLFKNNLPEAEKGKQYQLWAIVDGQPVDAGMIADDCEGLCKLKNIPNAQAFAITLEKEGGSPTPTMEQLYVLGAIAG